MIIDVEKITDALTEFIRSNVFKDKLKGAVIAASGGIDSSVTLSLAVRALGKENVKALTMPERDVTPESDVTDVMQLSRLLDVTCDLVEITLALDALQSILHISENTDKVCKGNLRPRIRMAIAYYYANTLQRMVIGSSNKTELLTGYFTKYGDGASDLMPLGDLFKSQVRQLARHLGIPNNIIEKAPSARLWPGQTSEGELGLKFDILDLILIGLERGMRMEEIAVELNVSESTVIKVADRVRSNEHKRRLPLILRLSSSES